MSKSLMNIALNLTAAVPLPGILLDSTPLLGGKGRNAILNTNLAPVAGVFKLQGNNKPPARTSAGVPVPPVDGDAGWFDIVTINAANVAAKTSQEIVLPQWIRANVTTLQAGATAFPISLEGIQ